MDEQKEQAKEAAVNVAKEEGTKVLEKAVKGTEAEKALKTILGGKKDTSATATDTAKSKPAVPVTQEEVKEKVEDEAKKKIQNLLKRKKN